MDIFGDFRRVFGDFLRSSEILREIWKFFEIFREFQRVSTGSQGVSKSFREFQVVFGGLLRFLERLRDLLEIFGDVWRVFGDFQ